MKNDSHVGIRYIPELETCKPRDLAACQKVRKGMENKLDHPCYIEHMLYKDEEDNLFDYEEVRDITKDSVSVASITVRFEKKEG